MLRRLFPYKVMQMLDCSKKGISDDQVYTDVSGISGIFGHAILSKCFGLTAAVIMNFSVSREDLLSVCSRNLFIILKLFFITELFLSHEEDCLSHVQNYFYLASAVFECSRTHIFPLSWEGIK